MKNKTYLLALTLLLALAAPAAAIAADGGHLSIGLGVYDVLDEDEAADFRLEYRPDTKILFGLKPWLGAEITSDASIWTGGGILYDWNFANSWFLTPSFGAGFYDEGDSGKDLDYALQFRSQLELGYQFENQHRVGLAFGHLSNASLGDDNPGTEVLNVYWHVPLGTDF
ncbi:MAG: acyloxyacyl hydrolase [Alphaproteobacteria bacterium]